MTDADTTGQDTDEAQTEVPTQAVVEDAAEDTAATGEGDSAAEGDIEERLVAEG